MIYKPQGTKDKELFEALGKEDLVTKLGTCKSPEECYEATKPYVTGITFEEYTDLMKLINTSMEENKDGLLSEEDMSLVAGGCHTCEIVTTGAAVIGAAASAAGAAS